MSHPFLTKLADIARFQFQAGRADEAESSCRQLLQLEPENMEAGYLLARILLSARRYDEAIELLEPAVLAHPEQDFIVDDCRRAFIDGSRSADGVACFRELRKRHPGLPRICLNLGLLHSAARQYEDARACFEVLLSKDPEHVEALFALGQNILERSGPIEAEPRLRSAASLASRRPDILNVHAGVLKTLGRADEAAEVYRQAVELSPCDTRLYSNYLMNFLCTDRFSPEYIAERHVTWGRGQLSALPSGEGEHRNLPDPGRRLRIGYVSADFRCHPVAFFIDPILSQHDQGEVEVYCYAQLQKSDFITEQIRAKDVAWRPLAGLSDREAADLVREDGIDILVDLNGHTASSRLSVFALKPAPVQVTWLGYAHSTGLPCIDYRFTDLVADPPGLTEHLHSERLYRLKGSFICYQPPQDPPPVSELPLNRNGYITFGAFNTLAKWTPGMLDLWCAVLREVPDSRLLLKVAGLDREEMRAYVTGLFTCRGVCAERLLLRPRVPTVLDHLRFLGEADIALDSSPYNGTTTTCESLFMGIPVVTLAGRSHISRVGASILTASGLEELIAGTPERYLDTAVALARDRRRLERYRAGLREQVSGSPFFQVERFTRTLEAAYRDVWQRWCATREEEGGKGQAAPRVSLGSQ